MRIEPGNCLEVMARLAAAGERVHAVVTDPPYHLTSIVKRFGGESAAPAAPGVYGRSSKGFMGKQWDGGDIAFRPETWALCLDLLPPGGHLLAFASTRTYHRIACAVEDAGFEIRDQIGWLYGSGFPKSHDVAKGIDKALGGAREQIRVPADFVRNPKATGAGRDGMEGATRPWIEAALERGYHEKDGDIAATPEAENWDGWGTALKPAWEPICVARKPLDGTVAANVLEHGTGALNIDGCRVQFASNADKAAAAAAAAAAEQRSRQVAGRSYEGWGMEQQKLSAADYAAAAGGQGRWPANLVHDGSDEVIAAFPSAPGMQRAVNESFAPKVGTAVYGDYGPRPRVEPRGDSGSAARFFYTAKATAEERTGSKHPTVKPLALMRWLVRLVTPPGGVVLDPFAGTGTTGIAAQIEGFDSILIEREAEYLTDIRERVANLTGASERMEPSQPSLFTATA